MIILLFCFSFSTDYQLRKKSEALLMANQGPGTSVSSVPFSVPSLMCLCVVLLNDLS
jgi:hypothetical protein